MFVIYLDIDGVLAPYPYFSKQRIFAPIPLSYLERFILEILEYDIPVEICVTGAWAKLYTADELSFILENYNIPVGGGVKVTNINDIPQKCDHHKYIIIDDEAEVNSDDVIKPDSKFGIRKEDYLKMKYLFNTLMNYTLIELELNKLKDK